MLEGLIHSYLEAFSRGWQPREEFGSRHRGGYRAIMRDFQTAA